MPFTVAKALEMEVFHRCRLLTGRAGLDNEILWVNILEILDDLSHIEPGEFLITTAHDFNAHSESSQQNMIEFFAARKLAAVAIQTGHYLKEIPASFIRFSEEHNIPLIEIAPEVSFKNLTRALMNELMRGTQFPFDTSGPAETGEKLKSEAVSMKKFWRRLIENEKPESLRLDMEKYNLSFHGALLVLVLTVGRSEKGKPGQAGEIITELFGQAEQAVAQFLREHHIPFLLGPSGRHITLLVQSDQLNKQESEADAIIARRLFEELNLLFPGYTIQVGYSGIHSGIEQLEQALDEAEKALQAVQIGLFDHTNIAAFKAIGLYRLVMDVRNVDTLKGIFQETAAPLLEYDRHSKGALLQTLEAFLQTGSIKQAAEDLFVHRHTMKYRLEQIVKLTGYNPLIPKDALQLNIGLHVYRYLEALNLLS